MKVADARVREADGAGRVVGPGGLERTLLIAILFAALLRLAYHVAYMEGSPFALAPITDGRALELGARNVGAAFPLGTQPLQLVSLYPFVLGIPLSVLPWMAFVLFFQLTLAALGLWAFHRSARRLFGLRAAALSTLALMLYPALAFYENKFLAVELVVLCTIGVLFTFERALAAPRTRRFVWLGCLAGALLLTTPAALVSVPLLFVAVAVACRDAGRRAAPALCMVLLGLGLVLGAMATRNLHVVGRAQVLGRHALSIPIFIGNNPAANGAYNDGDRVIDRGSPGGRLALVDGLGLSEVRSHATDDAIDRALLDRAARFVRERPRQTGALAARKLALLSGNDEPTAHYDMHGEAAMLGGAYRLGPPFGFLAALGLLGVLLLRRGRLTPRPEGRCSPRALGWLVAALTLGPLLWMLLGFVSSPQRVPVAVPLALMSGPALLSLLRLGSRAGRPALRARRTELTLCACVLMQAFVPRGTPDEVGAWHHFHVGEVHERVGSFSGAVASYAQAIASDPEEPVFLLRQARLLMVLLEMEAADAVLARLERLDGIPSAVRRDAEAARAKVDVVKRRWKAEGRWRGNPDPGDG